MSEKSESTCKHFIEYDRYLDNLLSELIRHITENQIGLLSFCVECDESHELLCTLQEIYDFLEFQWDLEDQGGE
jgi:hypothetical protein